MGVRGKENEYSQTGKMLEDAQVTHKTDVQALEAELREAGDKLVKLEHEKHKVQLELIKSRESENDLTQRLLKHSTVITIPNGMRDPQPSVRSATGAKMNNARTHARTHARAQTPHIAFSPHAEGNFLIALN